MPPNADQSHLRQRLREKNFPVDEATRTRTQTSTPQDRLDSIQNLKDTEVAIDGIIYDLNDFDHPGGNSLFIFGGNDVTVLYNMIHPTHTHHHLKKLTQVGRVSDWKKE